jgi:hypothetical protein
MCIMLVVRCGVDQVTYLVLQAMSYPICLHTKHSTTILNVGLVHTRYGYVLSSSRRVQ